MRAYTWPGVGAIIDHLSNPDLYRCAGKIRSYPVAVHEDGKCSLKGSTFLSLEAAVDFFSENELDGVHLVTVSAHMYLRLLLPWCDIIHELCGSQNGLIVVACNASR